MDPIELKLSCEERCGKVQNILSGFNIQNDRLQKFQEVFISELEAGNNWIALYNVKENFVLFNTQNE